MTFRSDRHFQLWDYSVSHRQMLLRSPTAPGIDTNIDIAFVGVRYLEIPTLLEGVEIEEASPGDRAEVLHLVGKLYDDMVFVLRSGGRRHAVVAFDYRVMENELDLFESSLEYFNDEAAARDRGVFLVKSGRRPAEAVVGNGHRSSVTE